MGAREPSVAVEACYPSLALDGGRDASRVFARSSCLPLESARGSGGAEGRRCRVSGLRKIVRVAKGGRVLLRPQTATRTCIIVRTITLQLAWTSLKGLISCKRIEVSDICEDRVSGLLPGATPSRSPCLASPHPTPPQPVTAGAVCGVSWQLKQTPPAAPQAPCPQ